MNNLSEWEPIDASSRSMKDADMLKKTNWFPDKTIETVRNQQPPRPGTREPSGVGI